MIWLWLGLSIVVGLPLLFVLAAVGLTIFLRIKMLPLVVRIFQETPLFIIPRGQPVGDAEEVRFPTSDGLTLKGCYLSTPAERRQGVILFGLEFGSNRWSCIPYCQCLLDNGFDIFAFESRGQGQSDPHPGYSPIQWVTNLEVRDVQAALDYLKSRPDADPRGVGFYGISKGGSAGLMAAAQDDYVRCFVTDGIFATHTTMVPYMLKWVILFSPRKRLQKILPVWYYGFFAHLTLRHVGKASGCRFPHLEQALPQLGPRPLLMIHGGADTYIKPEMAQDLFARVKGAKEFWLVERAKHNQALQVAGNEYRQRVLAFFEAHLANEFAPASQVSVHQQGRPQGMHKPVGVMKMAESRESIAERR